MAKDFKPYGLGDRVKDPVTGFTGIVECLSYWLNGCIRSMVQPEELKEGKPVEPHAFDYNQLRLVKAGVHKPKVLAEITPPPETRPTEDAAQATTGGPPREGKGFRRA